MIEKKFYIRNNTIVDDEKNKDYEILLLSAIPMDTKKEYFPLTKHFCSYKSTTMDELKENNPKEYKRQLKLYHYDNKCMYIENKNSEELMAYNPKTKTFEQIKTIERNGEIIKRKYKINTLESFGVSFGMPIKATTAQDHILEGFACPITENGYKKLYLINVKYDEENEKINIEFYYKIYTTYNFSLQMQKKIQTYVLNLKTHQSYMFDSVFAIPNDEKKRKSFKKNTPKQKSTPKRAMQNISRGNVGFPNLSIDYYKMVSYVEDIIIDYVSKKHNMKVSKKIIFKNNGEIYNELIEYCNNGKYNKDKPLNPNYGLQYLCKLNYNPLCPELVNYKGFFDNRFREVFQYENPNQLNEFYELFHIPKTLGFKKLFNEDCSLFFLYLLLQSMEFTNIDIVYKILKLYQEHQNPSFDCFIFSNLNFKYRGNNRHGKIVFNDYFNQQAYKQVNLKNKAKTPNVFLSNEFCFLPIMYDIFQIKKEELKDKSDKKISTIQMNIIKKIEKIFFNDSITAHRYNYFQNTILDTFMMYTQCRNYLDKDVIKRIWDDNLGDWSHTLLSRISQNTKYKDISLSSLYPKNVKKLACHYGDYAFKLPSISNDIIKLAVELDNCVAGYIDSVIYRHCVIIGLYHRNQPVACIELLSKNQKAIDINTNEFTIHQFKLCHNIPAYCSKQIFKIANQWIKDNKNALFILNSNSKFWNDLIPPKNNLLIVEKKLISLLDKNETTLDTISGKYEFRSLSKLNNYQYEYDNDNLDKKLLKQIRYETNKLCYSIYKNNRFIGTLFQHINKESECYKVTYNTKDKELDELLEKFKNKLTNDNKSVTI